jgi:DNA-binding CsgD family transcriptional regulator
MLVFGTQIHIVTFIFIVLEFCMFNFQLARYCYRPQDKHRGWYLLLLGLMLVYNITGGLFPDRKINISIGLQMIIAYGSGFIMASYFPFYFYKALELKALRWHALYGVPLFLMLPYLIFFVADYAISGNIDWDIKYGMIVPLIYAVVLLFVMFKAIRGKFNIDHNRNAYAEEIALYCAVSPWAALAFFGLVEESQLIEVLCTNTGIVSISILFIGRSIKIARAEHEQAVELNMAGINMAAFEVNSSRYQLTKRQVEIVVLLWKGNTYKAIAETLFISEKTVNNHIQNIYEKTGSNNKLELIHKLAKNI